MTCPRHRPRPVGPPRLHGKAAHSGPSGFEDTVLRCEACGEVSVRTTWGEAKAEPQQMALALEIEG